MSTTLRELLARGLRILRVRSHQSPPRVDRLMDSLSAPASPRELAREDDAVAAFERARLVSPTSVRSNETSPRTVRTGLKAALATVGVAALMSTGAAFAAGGHAPWSHSTVGEATSPATATHPTHPSHPVHSSDPSSTVADPHAHGYVGLCRAYAAGTKASHGHALSARAFTALATAAGGADNVATFCAALPTKPDQSLDHPGDHPRRPPRQSRRDRPAVSS